MTAAFFFASRDPALNTPRIQGSVAGAAAGRLKSNARAGYTPGHSGNLGEGDLELLAHEQVDSGVLLLVQLLVLLLHLLRYLRTDTPLKPYPEVNLPYPAVNLPYTAVNLPYPAINLPYPAVDGDSLLGIDSDVLDQRILDVVQVQLSTRGGLVFKAHRFCVSLNSRLERNKEEEDLRQRLPQPAHPRRRPGLRR